MYRITSVWLWTFICQKYPVYTEYTVLAPKDHNLVSFAPQPAVSRHKVVEVRKCTEWSQSDLEHLTVKLPCMHWILTLPRAQIFIFIIWSTSIRFRDTRLSINMIGNAPNYLRLTLYSSLSNYPVCPEYFPRGPSFGPFCSTNSQFRDTRLPEKGNAPNDLRLTLTVTSTLYTLNTCQDTLISLYFTLQWLLFQIIAVLGFPIFYKFMMNAKFTEKIGNSKSKNIKKK